MAKFEVVKVEPSIRLTISIKEAESLRKVLGRHDSSAVLGEDTWPVFKALVDALTEL